MSELVQLWRGRLEWLQGAGVTVAAGAEAFGVSVASVHRWRKLLAMARSPGGAVDHKPIHHAPIGDDAAGRATVCGGSHT